MACVHAIALYGMHYTPIAMCETQSIQFQNAILMVHSVRARQDETFEPTYVKFQS